jgi:hypothetical protein
MKYFEFDGWDTDNSSALNIVFGSIDDLKNISSVEFLELFGIDEHEDEGELQRFEYIEHVSIGTHIEKTFESDIFSFIGDEDSLREFIDRFNVDYVWHYNNEEFKLLHNNSLDGNDFSEASENFKSNENIKHFWISRLVSF